MNKDEMKEKAQELTIKNVTDGKSKYYSWGYYKGCLAGLEYNKKQTADLEKENTELKEQISIKDIQIKELQKQKVYWKESSFDWRHKYFKKGSTKRLVQKDKQLTKAKEIIKELKAWYTYPIVTKEDLKRQDEILAEVEQFLNSEVEK